MSLVQTAVTESEIIKCRRAIQALRPFLTDDIYLEEAKKTIADNRQFVFIEENNEAAAVAVFETGYNLFRGRYIYIDDLSTLAEHRGKGYASILLDWIIDYAKKEHYQEVHLDSGVNDARSNAHRLYLNKRFQITSLHFVTKI